MFPNAADESEDSPMSQTLGKRGRDQQRAPVDAPPPSSKRARNNEVKAPASSGSSSSSSDAGSGPAPSSSSSSSSSPTAPAADQLQSDAQLAARLQSEWDREIHEAAQERVSQLVALQWERRRQSREADRQTGVASTEADRARARLATFFSTSSAMPAWFQTLSAAVSASGEVDAGASSSSSSSSSSAPPAAAPPALRAPLVHVAPLPAPGAAQLAPEAKRHDAPAADVADLVMRTALDADVDRLAVPAVELEEGADSSLRGMFESMRQRRFEREHARQQMIQQLDASRRRHMQLQLQLMPWMAGSMGFPMPEPRGPPIGKWVLEGNVKHKDEPAATSSEQCIVCMERRRVAVLRPCGHMIMCRECATDARRPARCPECRADLIGALIPFDAIKVSAPAPAAAAQNSSSSSTSAGSSSSSSSSSSSAL